MKRDSWVVAVDIGGTEVKAGLVSRDGKLRARAGVRSNPGSLTGFRRNMVRLLRELHPKSHGMHKTVGIGIGCKGIVDTAACRVHRLPGPFTFLEGVPLGDWIRAEFGAELPVAMDNDAKTALTGEQRWGAARGKSDVILLTLGTGVGGAVLSNGRMIAGTTNAGGHLGHITVDFHGPECFCGNTGCVEAFFSARAIEGDALAAVRRGCETSLRSAFATNPEKLTCLDVFSAAHAGDRTATEIIRRAVSALAAAMAGMAHTFDPELFVLGGRIAESGEMLLAPLRTELHRRTSGIVGRRIPIRRTALGDSMGVLGAAALAWNVIGQ